jgi:phosphate/phosphite/phosphonate ABC transporter binding protein
MPATMTEPAAPLSFAIISSAPAASALLEVVCEQLARGAGLTLQPVVVRSYDKLVAAVREGQVQIAWAPPLVALELERDTRAHVLLCSRRAGRVDYSSVLFARRDGGPVSLAELRGKRVAWVARESSAGYVVPRMKLVAEGLDPATLFASESFRRTHEAVPRAVLSGDADVGATYASFGSDPAVPVSAGWFDAGAKNDEVRILASAGPIPTDVIAVSDGASEAVRERLAAAFASLGPTVKQLLNADGFERPEASHLDELRALVERAKQGPAA